MRFPLYETIGSFRDTVEEKAEGKNVGKRENVNERKGMRTKSSSIGRLNAVSFDSVAPDGFTRARICKCARPRTNASRPFA